jgi:hypothetical protein
MECNFLSFPFAQVFLSPFLLKEAKENERLEVISSEKTIFIAKVWAGC